jgi:mono/diheme cytochrome c family protein
MSSPISIIALILGFAMSAPGAEPIIGGLGERGPKDELVRGLVLLSELNCTSCHQSDSKLPMRRGGPVLSGITQRFSTDHLLRFIGQPQVVKPGTVMPDVLGHLTDEERGKVAGAIGQYLILSPDAGSAPPAINQGDIEKGRKLYSTIGCLACHGPDQEAARQVPLGLLAEKYHLPSLVEFLKNPLRHRPNGRMPDLRLTHFEALDLATYLLGNPTIWPKISLSGQAREAGRRYFTQFGCAQCHDRSPTGGVKHRPLAELRTDHGCLSNQRGSWPDYGLNQSQISALKLAVRSHAEPLSPRQEIDLRLTQLNCIACHQRGDLGGVSEILDAHFTGTDPNLGDQGRIPPPLTGVGAKLKPDWMRKILVHGESARPYLNTRMPKFGAAEVEPLIKLFARVDELEAPPIDRVKDAKLAKNEGMKLAGSRGGLNCVACHTFRLESAAPIKALDLTTMTDRLQEGWFHQYLRHPQRYQPLTIMPSFWPDGKAALTNVLDGNAGRQIDALWQYLSYGRNVRAPAGIAREPLELAVGSEAVMLRRNYPGIGKRGIGVGYPAGVNLSFDAGQARLASIWQGGFIEASAAWRGQGSGAVRPLSREVIRFPAGAAFAKLDDLKSAWPTNEARQLPGLQFRGYTLDKLQRPTFSYELDGNLITDQFTDRKDASGKGYFERHFLLSRPVQGLHFRATKESNLKSVDERTVRVGRSLLIRFPVKPTIRGDELLFDLSGMKEFKLEYHW